MRDFESWDAQTDKHYFERDCLAFDLDDTLTERGEIPSEVLRHLELCGEKQLLRLLVTGRSAGWADALIKLLPFDAVVAENGAVLRYFPDRRSGRKPQEKAREEFWNPGGHYEARPPAAIRERHQQALERILKENPGVQVASDQPYRIYDLAVDFCEEVDPPLGLDVAEKIKLSFERMGATAKVSSIHVNGWWGDFSKIEGLERLLSKVYRKSVEKNLIYVGDSPNDGPLFASPALSVGVANVRDFQALSFHRPGYITRHRSALGAIEVMKKVLDR